MNTYKVFLSNGNDVVIDALTLRLSDGEATFYNRGGDVCGYFYKPIGIIKLSNN